MMIFDNVDFGSLPHETEAAFRAFEALIREQAEFLKARDLESSENYDQNGQYIGSFPAERAYLNAINAFIDEYNIDLIIPDISALNGYEYKDNYEEIRGKISYYIIRSSLRENRIQTGKAGTIIYYESEYKSEIGNLLNTIRKIVNQEVKESKKKDKIFSKIASLQSEIDRDKTTVDAIFSRAIELSEVIGQCAQNIDPLVKKMAQLKEIFWEKSTILDTPPKVERQKLLPKGSSNIENMDDEIPF